MQIEDFWAQAHTPAVMRATRKSRDRQLAEDVVADVFLEMGKRWDTVEHPRAYLSRAVDNRLASRWRRVATQDRHLPALALAFEGQNGRDDSGHAVLRLDVARAIASLPPRQRQTVSLRFLEDRSVEDTAAELGISEGAVKAYTARGLATLRNRLEDDREDLVA